MTKDFLFVNGQVKALESRLLNESRLERMVGAATAEEAFRVMVELEYAEYFDESTKPQDFGNVIEQGLCETKKLIQSGGNFHPGYDLFFAQFDLNNLKQALHHRLVDHKGILTEDEFTEDHGYSPLGNLTLEDINNTVFHNRASENVPTVFVEAVANASKILDEKKHFRFVEYTLDKAYLEHVLQISGKSKNSFLKQFAQRMIDATNFRVLARSILLHKEDLPGEAFAEGGYLTLEDLGRIRSIQDVAKYMSSSELYPCAQELLSEKSDGEKIQAFEQCLDQQMQLFLKDAASDDMQSIAVSMDYFERRLRDARRLRFIMYSKFHGLDSNFIFNTLKTLS